jgi:hypothetical protein
VTASSWFREVPSDLPVASRAVVAALVEMLDVVQPQALDRARTQIRTTGHGWAEYDVEFRLAHADDADADITVAVGSDEALLSWLMAHEHVCADDGDAERPWTTVVVDAVAALLRGEYEVRDHYRRDRLVKTSVHDTLLGDRHVSTSGSLLGLLPFLRRVDRVERRTVDFRCRG